MDAALRARFSADPDPAVLTAMIVSRLRSEGLLDGAATERSSKDGGRTGEPTGPAMVTPRERT